MPAVRTRGSAGPGGTARHRLTVGIIGLGHVGLATGVAFASHQIPVVGFDSNELTRAQVTRGETPFYESGLATSLRKVVARRLLTVAGSTAEVVRSCDPVLISIPTPAALTGRADLRQLRAVLADLAHAFREAGVAPTVAIKSTVPPGTGERFARPLVARISELEEGRVGIASNPEFLAEGTMLRDAQHPQRIVIGTSRVQDRLVLRDVYRPFHAPIIELSPTAAELVKYASNAFLALKVTYANEISRIAECVGEDADEVLRAVGRDSRIGGTFLSPGPGYGGSCFSKDLSALLFLARELGVAPRVISAVPKANDDQTVHASRLIRSTLKGRKRPIVALLGLSFKEGTEDARESRALPILRALLKAGARVRLYDPIAVNSFRREWAALYGDPFPSHATFHRSARDALRGAHVAVLHTAVPGLRTWPRTWTRLMAPDPAIVDLRRALPTRVRTDPTLTWIGLGVGGTDGSDGGKFPVGRSDETCGS